MNATKKAVYLTPQLTAVEIKPERGFALSPGQPLMDQLNLWVYEEGIVSQDRQNNVETYHLNDNWTQGDNHFWE